MAEHNGWTPGDTAALNEPTIHILHSIPTGEKYEEVTALLENCYRDHHLAESFHVQLSRMVQ
jgi:hypothetical protein